METTIMTVTSRDGTPIACRQSGTGPPLILVPGTGGANPAAWTAVIPTLNEHFTVHAVDRRGHGESGDSREYAVEREFEDLVAVNEALNEPANVLGHSFGGFVALEAALLTDRIRRLIIYEAGMPLPGRPRPPGMSERLQPLLDAGDREGVVLAHYRAVMAPDEVEMLRSSPVWHERLATAHTLPREWRVTERHTFDPGRYGDMRTPTLLLLGGDSPPLFSEATEALDAALPNSRIAVMPGQKHTAMYTAPDLFLREVLGFLTEPDASR